MSCKEYMALTPLEKQQLHGLLWHLIQNDSRYFRIADMVVKRASDNGLLDGVVIMPQAGERKGESSFT